MTTHKYNPHAGAEQEYVLEDEETVAKAVAETKAVAPEVEPDRFSTGGATAEEIAEWRAAHAPKAKVEPKAEPKPAPKPDPEPEPAWRKSRGK